MDGQAPISGARRCVFPVEPRRAADLGLRVLSLKVAGALSRLVTGDFRLRGLYISPRELRR